MLHRLHHLFLAISFLFIVLGANAQPATLEGYTFEDNNRGYLYYVEIDITDKATGRSVVKTASDEDGAFTAELPVGKEYVLTARKAAFEDLEMPLSTKDVKAGGKFYTKVKLQRSPGYLFEMTLAEKRTEEDEEVDAIGDAWIEVYNNTEEKEVYNNKNWSAPSFSTNFERGNHYTIMVRKDGYFTKRLEAYVDIDGCILCMDGVDEIQPGAAPVSDNLTGSLQRGSLLANIELEPARIDEPIKLANIYYDLGKADIRDDAAAELDRLVAKLKVNPRMIVELGSHTDSRGSAGSNQALSQKRAEAAVNYLTKMGGIEPFRVSARGYGESKLVNRCKDGVKCSERRHQQNRRTEMKITGFLREGAEGDRSLAAIIKEERFAEKLAELENQEIYVAPGETPPGAAAPVADTDAPLPAPATKADALAEVAVPGEQAKGTPTPPAADPVEAVAKTYGGNVVQLLPRGYSGYMVEIVRAKTELDSENAIFDRHSNIMLDRLGNGHASYLLGDFDDRKDAEWFLDNVVLKLYPKARIITFDEGRRSI